MFPIDPGADPLLFPPDPDTGGNGPVGPSTGSSSGTSTDRSASGGKG